MKVAITPALLAACIAVALLASVHARAQQAPPAGRVGQVSPSERHVSIDVQRERDPRHVARTPMTFQMLQFTFRTGGDDLRDDSVVTAGLEFPDGSRQVCYLHGRHAAGGAANISWDNNSTHAAPPCRLDKPRTIVELRGARVFVGMFGPGNGPNYAAAVFGGPVGLAASMRSPDNWNINRADVQAYNPASTQRVCVFSTSANPVARLTGDQPTVALSEFPNQCR